MVFRLKCILVPEAHKIKLHSILVQKNGLKLLRGIEAYPIIRYKEYEINLLHFFNRVLG